VPVDRDEQYGERGVDLVVGSALGASDLDRNGGRVPRRHGRSSFNAAWANDQIGTLIARSMATRRAVRPLTSLSALPETCLTAARFVDISAPQAARLAVPTRWWTANNSSAVQPCSAARRANGAARSRKATTAACTPCHSPAWKPGHGSRAG